MAQSIIRVILSLLLALVLQGCKGSPAASVQTEGEIHTYEVGTGITIEVYTPEGYRPENRYPVALFNDGEQLFSSSGWNLARTLDGLIDQDEIEPVIAVAIHAEGNRLDWYTPYEDPWITNNWGNYTPQAEIYAGIIMEEILPFIKDEFAIDETRVGIFGASLGGLFATWMGLHYPEVVTYSAGLSPSFWVAGHAIFEDLGSGYSSNHKFWFDIGTAEWNYYVPLYRALDQEGMTPGKNSFYYEVPDAEHSVSYWSERVRLPLKIFYGPPNPSPRSMEIVLECIPSQSRPGVFFRRMNPIITLSNDVRFSLAHRANYELLNGGGELGSEGSFRKDEGQSMEVRVTYRDFEQLVEIPKSFCE